MGYKQTPYAILLSATALGYLLAALLGIAFTRQGGNIAALWPANAILVGVLLRTTTDRWGGYITVCMLANGLANWLTGDTLAVSAGFVIANGVEVISTVAVARRLMPLPVVLHRPLQPLQLVGAGLLGTAVGASAGAATVALAYSAPYWSVWVTWWVADAMGLAIVTPALLSASRTAFNVLWRKRAAETSALTLLVVVITLMIFIVSPSPAMTYLVAPLLLWCGHRLGPFACAVLGLTIALITLTLTLQGVGPIAGYSAGNTLNAIHELQLFLGLTVLPALTLSIERELRRRAEADARRSRALDRSRMEQLRLITDAVPGLVAYLDTDCCFRFANASYRDWFGVNPDALPGRHMSEILGEDMARHQQPYIDRVLTGESVQFDYQRNDPPPSDRQRHVVVDYIPHKNAAGRVLGFFALVLDITERKRTEQSLAVSERRFRDFARGSADWFWETDAEQRFVWLSEGVEERSGVPPEALLGKTRNEIGLIDHSPDIQRYQTVRQKHQPFRNVDMQFKVPVHGKKTPLWIRSSGIPMFSPDGDFLGYRGSSSNITALKAAEKEHQRLQRDLVVASRLAGQAEIATGILHNIGNVLNSLNVSMTMVGEGLHQSRLPGLGQAVELLDKQADLGAFFATKQGTRLHDYLRTLHRQLVTEQQRLGKEFTAMRKGVEHIKQIVAHQQTFAKRVGAAEPAVLSEVVDEVLSLIIGEHHAILVERDYRLLSEVTVDKQQLLQILINLVSNAKQALQDSACPAPQIVAGIEPGPGEGEFSVRIADNGPGVAPSLLEKIFAFGFTTKNYGHGYGLHVSANAARAMGGRLYYQTGGPGAIFVLTLPTTPAGADAARADAASADAAHGALANAG